jgi:hypothetical protein
MAQIQLIAIRDCSRGLSDFYPARLDDNQVSVAWDVEFWDAMVAGRRNGTVTVFTNVAGGHILSLFVFTPTTSRADDRLAAAVEGLTVSSVSLFDATYTQTGLIPTPDDHLQFGPGVDWASLHGKLFVAARSDVDRLHVYDPATSTLRRAGLAGPVAAPVVATTGAGTFSGTRQYRVRYTVQASGITIGRSEPSPATTFVPPGTGLAARITMPAVPAGIPASHWEVEEIDPANNWYRIATVSAGTTTYDDTLALSQVATTGTLSADIGAYTPPPSVKWLTVDADRLIMGGSWTSDALSARVWWTPLGGDPGVGNDERLEMAVSPFLDFDTLDGGGLTGIKAWEGKVIVFKAQQVHQMVRSTSRLKAYIADTISRRHGALPLSLVEGTDIDGLSALYFLDPMVGPMQLGFKGLRVLAPHMQHAWRTTVNPAATQMCAVEYHPDKRQVWWYVATGSSLFPNVRWMYSVESDGLVFHSVAGAQVRGAVTFKGKPHFSLEARGGPGIIRGDETGRAIEWDNSGYRAYIRSRAFVMGGMIRRFMIGSAVLEATAQASGTVGVRVIRDYGVEQREVSVATDPVGTERFALQPIDNLYIAEALAVEFELGDLAVQAAAAFPAWQIQGATFAWDLGSPSTGRG